MLIACVVVITVAATIVGLLISTAGDRSSAEATQATTTVTTTSAPSTTSGTPTTSTSAPRMSAPPTTTPSSAPAGPASCEGFTAGPAPQTPPGWRQVVGPRGLAYDVPPGWTVKKCTTLIGWEKPCEDGPFGFCPIRTMSGAATLPSPRCLSDDDGAAGLSGPRNVSNITDAVDAEAALVRDIYTSEDGHVPTVSLSAPRNLTVGGAPAVQVVATVTDIAADECAGPTALHSIVATTVPGQDGFVVFVISLEQGVAGAPDPTLVDQMVASLRPAARS